MVTDDQGHPLDLELYDLATHLQTCERCRRHLARILYYPREPHEAE
jgi:hypothetical protein